MKTKLTVWKQRERLNAAQILGRIVAYSNRRLSYLIF